MIPVEMLASAEVMQGKVDAGEIIGFTHRWHWFPDAVEDIAKLLAEIERIRRLPEFPFDAEAAGEDFADLSDECGRYQKRAEAAESALAAERQARLRLEAQVQKLEAATAKVPHLAYRYRIAGGMRTSPRIEMMPNDGHDASECAELGGQCAMAPSGVTRGTK